MPTNAAITHGGLIRSKYGVKLRCISKMLYNGKCHGKENNFGYGGCGFHRQ